MADTDTVAQMSPTICACMSSSSTDALIAYIKHFGKVDGGVSSPRMLSIDSKGMDLWYRTTDSPNERRDVRIEFDPPLRSHKEVSQRFYKMHETAKKALSNVKEPQITITHFEMPSEIGTTASLLLFLIYITSMPSQSTSYFWFPARIFRYILPGVFFRIPLAFVSVIHVVGAMYTASLVLEHRMPWYIAMARVGFTTIFGWPVLTRLQDIIFYAQHEAMMKEYRQKKVVSPGRT